MQRWRCGDGQAGVIIRPIAPDQLPRHGIHRIHVADKVTEVQQRLDLGTGLPGLDHNARANLGHRGEGPAHTAGLLVERP